MLKRLKNYEGYFVSDDGQIYSNLGQGNKNKDNRTMMYPLKQRINKQGYPRVILRNSVTGKRDELYIKRLVAEAFLPNPNQKPNVINIDGNYMNNKLDNLKWVTISEARQYKKLREKRK